MMLEEAGMGGMRPRCEYPGIVGSLIIDRCWWVEKPSILSLKNCCITRRRHHIPTTSQPASFQTKKKALEKLLEVYMLLY